MRVEWKQGRILLYFILAWALFVAIKLSLSYTLFPQENLGTILTVASLLFSFLIGYCLQTRYGRYGMIRDLNITRHAKCFNLIFKCRQFKDNKTLLRTLCDRLNSIAIMHELTSWKECFLEEPYYKRLYDIIPLIKVKNVKEESLFPQIVRDIDDINDLSRHLSAVGRDKLIFIHGILLTALSGMIILLVLSIPITRLFSIILVMVFPPVIMLANYLIYGYQFMIFMKESTSIEINQKLLDEIGRKRFYRKDRLRFVRPEIRSNPELYKTEHDLSGDEKKIYLDYISDPYAHL